MARHISGCGHPEAPIWRADTPRAALDLVRVFGAQSAATPAARRTGIAGTIIEWLFPRPRFGRGVEFQAADKVVYSSTLAAPRTANTRLERHFDPSAVRDLKAAASRDLLVGGPNLAGQALVAGLVDELALFVWPVVLGGRTPALPTDMRVDLKLIDEHRFGSGVVHLRYRLP